MVIEKATKIQLLSQATIIGMFTFMLVTFIIPETNANNMEIKINSQDIENVKLTIAETDIEKFDEKLDLMNIKLSKIILGMCGEFGGKYCE